MSTKIIKVNNSYKTIKVGGAIIFDGAATVTSVNGDTGAVVLNQDDVLDGATNKQYSQTEKTKLAGIESGAEVNTVDSVAGKTGAVTLDKSDVGLGNVDNTTDLNKPISTATQTALNAKQNTITNSDSITQGATNLFLTTSERTKLTNTSGTNTGDQDLSAFETTTQLNTRDTNNRNRANHTGTQTASTISDFQATVSANSDVVANTAKVTNQTHSGDMTGAGALTAQPAIITGKASATVAGGDLLLIADINDSNALKQVTAQSIADLGGGGYTDEQAQDAVGTILTDTTSIDLIYDDAGNTISAQREALTGAITASKNSNTTALGSFTTAQLNTALSDNDVATLAGAEGLTNKTITSPRINAILDTNGAVITTLTPVSSAVNNLEVRNNITGFNPSISAIGSDTNISINLIPKGTGRTRENGTLIPTVSSGDTLTNKTMSLGSNTITTTKAQLDTAVTDGNIMYEDDPITDLNATAHRVFYSDGSGNVTELALGADGTFLKSNGASVAPSFATPAGSGDVSKVGTPVNNQIGVWTGDGTIEGDANFTWTGTVLGVAGDVTVTDEVYDATTWNGSLEVPTKNALRDKIESMSGSLPTQTGNARKILRTDGTTAEWVDSNPGLTTYTIAADNAPARDKAVADYVCDGTADQVEINAALTALGTTGGAVILSRGTFNLSATIAVTGDGSTADSGKYTILGHGPDTTTLVPSTGVHAFTLTLSPKVNIGNMSVNLLGSSDGIRCTAPTSGGGDRRGFWHSEFSNIQFQGDSSTHSGWCMNLESPFRSTFRNIQGLNVGNGIWLKSHYSAFNPGNLVFQDCHMDLGIANGTAYYLQSADDGGFFNICTFIECDCIDSAAGSTTSIGWRFRGSGTSYFTTRDILVLRSNVELFNRGVVFEKAASIEFNGNYMDTKTGGTLFDFSSDSVNNHIKAFYTYVPSPKTTAFIVDANTDTFKPNVVHHAFARVETGGTLTITKTTATVLKQLYRDSDGSGVYPTEWQGQTTGLVVQDEGTELFRGTRRINFVGSGVTATNSGPDVTVTVTSGGITEAQAKAISRRYAISLS